MAGSYNDAPGRRMAWDDDGTVVLNGPSSANSPMSAVSAGDAILLNNEETGTTGVEAQNEMVILLFPEDRDIDGVFGAITNDGVTPILQEFESSADSTSGVDGTWDIVISNMPDHKTVYNLFRDNIENAAETAVLGVRLHGSTSAGNAKFQAFHIYGNISAGETPDRILFLDTENGDAVFVKVLDFGDVPRGQTQTRTFKIINNSSSLSINSIVVAAEDLYLNAGGWYEFSDDGSSWVTSHSVGNLANGAEDTIHLRQIIPDGETLGLQTARIKVSHASVT